MFRLTESFQLCLNLRNWSIFMLDLAVWSKVIEAPATLVWSSTHKNRLMVMRLIAFFDWFVMVWTKNFLIIVLLCLTFLEIFWRGERRFKNHNTFKTATNNRSLRNLVFIRYLLSEIIKLVLSSQRSEKTVYFFSEWRKDWKSLTIS